MRRTVALTLLLLLVLLLLFWAGLGTPTAGPSAVAKPASTAAPGPARRPNAAAEPNPSPVPAPLPTAPAPVQAATASAQSALLGQVSDSIRAVVAANSVPGRIVFLDFALDRDGLRLVGASGAAGRAKPAGVRTGFGFVHYEAFGPGGALVLAGSVEDPTRRRLEFPAGSNDGRIASTTQFNEEGTLAVRLPGEIAPARIVLYRERNPVARSAQTREILGDFRLVPTL